MTASKPKPVSDPLKLHNDCQKAGGGPHDLPPAEPVSDPKRAENLAESVKRLEEKSAGPDFRAWDYAQPSCVARKADIRIVLDALEEKTAENTMWQTQCQIAVAGRKSAEAKESAAGGSRPTLLAGSAHSVAPESECPCFECEARTQRERAEKAEAELAEANRTIEDMVGMEPCPKCETGISETCLGCKLAAANERADRVSKTLEDVVSTIGRAHVGHFGFYTAHMAHVSEDTLARWKAALAPAPPTDEPTTCRD